MKKFIVSIMLGLQIIILNQNCWAQSKSQIKLAGIFDLSGSGVIWGKAEKNSFLLAVKDFEKNNPEIKVKTQIEDSIFSNRQTVTAFHKLVSVDNFKYIVGPTWETSVAIMPLCETKKIVCIAPSYHSSEFYSRNWKYNFTAWFDDRGYTSAIAEEINQKKYKKVAIFAAITPYYDTLVDNFKKRLSLPISTENRVTLEERDFRTMISKIESGTDAILMLLDNTGQIQAFVKQWYELRKDRPDIYTDDLIIYLDPPEDMKKFGFKFSYSYPVFEEKFLSDFTSRYKAEYGTAPEASSATVAYDETMLLLNCIKKDPDTTKVANCIANTNDYQGFSGKFSFAGGQTVKNRVIAIKEF